jgi:DNA-binding winged helix-turn-helix (wHTH) protein
MKICRNLSDSCEVFAKAGIMQGDEGGRLREGDGVHSISPRGVYFKDFALDLQRCVLVRGDRELRLRPKSFDVLRHLADHAGRLVSKDELIKAAWPDVFVTDDSLVQCIKDIREALSDDAHQIIKTVPRRGYVFAAEPIERVSQPQAASTGWRAQTDPFPRDDQPARGLTTPAPARTDASRQSPHEVAAAETAPAGQSPRPTLRAAFEMVSTRSAALPAALFALGLISAGLVVWLLGSRTDVVGSGEVAPSPRRSEETPSHSSTAPPSGLPTTAVNLVGGRVYRRQTRPGEDVIVTRYASFNDSCEQVGVPSVTVMVAPTKGTITVRPGLVTLTVPWIEKKCIGVTLAGSVVTYSPRAGEVGDDTATIRLFSPAQGMYRDDTYFITIHP